jgi:hypothetical protein
MQNEPIFRPVDMISEPIRHENGAVVIQADNSRLCQVETLIVIGHD